MLAGIYIPHRFLHYEYEVRIYHKKFCCILCNCIFVANTLSIHCPYYCTVHDYVVIHFCDSMWSSSSGSESVQVFFIVCLYMYCRWRSSYQEGRIGIPVTGLNRHMFVPTPSQNLDFQRHISVQCVQFN